MNMSVTPKKSAMFTCTAHTETIYWLVNGDSAQLQGFTNATFMVLNMAEYLRTSSLYVDGLIQYNGYIIQCFIHINTNCHKKSLPAILEVSIGI